MKRLSLVTRFKIVGWEVAGVGALLSVLQLLALLGDTAIQPIERFAIYGGLGTIGLALILVAMEALALARRIAPFAEP